MPEWPDLAVVRRRVGEALQGSEVVSAEELRPLVLRLPVPGPLDRLLKGRVLADVALRGKFLTLRFDDGADLVINPMLAGLLALGRRAGACVRLAFARGAVLDYVDPKRMGKVYYLPPDATPEVLVPGYAGMGPDAPLAGVDAHAFRAAARGRRCEVRNLLLDPTFIAGIGNAYADEVLWAACLHPKRPVTGLSEAEWLRLHGAVRRVMEAAEAAVEAGLPAALGRKVRTHMKVRGRAGQACARCGARIVRRHLGYLETDFCPRCQPDPAGDFPVPEAGRGW